MSNVFDQFDKVVPAGAGRGIQGGPTAEQVQTNVFDKFDAAPVIPNKIQPEDAYIHPTATASDLHTFAKAIGLNTDIIPESAYEEAAKINAKYDMNFKSSSNVGEGELKFVQDLGNKIATVWRNPAEQETAKLLQAIDRSNAQQKGLDKQNITDGQYNAPTSEKIGYGVAGAMAAAPVAGAIPAIPGAGVLPMIGNTAIQGGVFGAIGNPNNMVTGGATGAVLGGVLGGTVAGVVGGTKLVADKVITPVAKQAAKLLVKDPEAATGAVTAANKMGVGESIGVSEIAPSTGNVLSKGSFSGNKIAQNKVDVANTAPEKAVVSLTESAGGKGSDWATPLANDPLLNAKNVTNSEWSKNWSEILQKEGAISTLNSSDNVKMSIELATAPEVTAAYKHLSESGKLAIQSAMVEKAKIAATDAAGKVDFKIMSNEINKLSKSLPGVVNKDALALDGLGKYFELVGNIPVGRGTDASTKILLGGGSAVASGGSSIPGTILMSKIADFLLKSPKARDSLMWLAKTKDASQIADIISTINNNYKNVSDPVLKDIITNFGPTVAKHAIKHITKK